MSKLVGIRLLKRLFIKRLSSNWKEFTSKAKSFSSKHLKKLVEKSWKIGLYSIGLLKIVSLFRKKTYLYAWNKVIKF